MSHKKNEFFYHKIFDNKYVEQSYIGYLTRGKKYLPRLNSWKDIDNQMNYNVIKPIDFIIRCNNAIQSRKPKEQNIKDVKLLFNREVRSLPYSDLYAKYPIEHYAWNLSDEEKKNEYVVKIHQIMEELISWKNRFEDNWDEFRDFIYDSIKYIDDNKLTYTVGENIAYSRSVGDKISKKYYCILIGEKGYKTFSNHYASIVSKNIDSKQVVNQISELLITICDVYNSIISKDTKTFEELTNKYIINNDMDTCVDIYYRRVYEDFKDFCKNKNNLTMTEQLQFLKSIITNENKKYSGKFIVYENIVIDESSLEDVDYFELD